MLDAGGETNAFSPARCTAATSSSGKVMIYLLRPSKENLIKSDCLSLEGNLDWYTTMHIMIHTIWEIRQVSLK